MTREIFKEADALFDTRKFDEAREAYRRVAEDPTSGHSDRTEAWSMMARTYLTTDRKEEGRPLLDRAAATATTEQPLGCSRYLSVKGRFQWKDGQTPEAIRTFQTLYDFCHAHHLHERAVDAANMMAILVPPADQVAWALRGIKEAVAGQVTRGIAPLWNNLGAAYEDLGRYPEAIDAYTKAREFHWRHGTELSKLKADWALGHAYRLAKDYENAQMWLNPIVAWCERIGEIEFLGWTWHELGQIEAEEKNRPQALEYLEAAQKYLEQAGIAQWDAATHQKLLDQIKSLSE